MQTSDFLQAFGFACLRLGLMCLRIHLRFILFVATSMQIVRVTKNCMPRLVQAILLFLSFFVRTFHTTHTIKAMINGTAKNSVAW